MQPDTGHDDRYGPDEGVLPEPVAQGSQSRVCGISGSNPAQSLLPQRRCGCLCPAGRPNALYVLPLADHTWDETERTFRTALDLYGPVPLGLIEGRPEGWHDLGVTDYVRRRATAQAGGNTAFGLRAVANDAPTIQIDSREGLNPPQLVLHSDRQSGP